MVKYRLDGAILFIVESTTKTSGYRIPNYRSRDRLFKIPEAKPIDIELYSQRPATLDEYNEWASMTHTERVAVTQVLPITWVIGGKFIIEGMTVSWIFDPDPNIGETSPD
jgi:hypothetical protein